jgi:hypothetical protein
LNLGILKVIRRRSFVLSLRLSRRVFGPYLKLDNYRAIRIFVYLFAAYVITLFVIQAIYRRTIRMIKNSVLGRVWKEAVPD